MTDHNAPAAVAARLAAILAKKPDWYDAAPFRFENGVGEDWGARIRRENGKIFVDLTGCDVEYEVRSVPVSTRGGISMLFQRFGWVLSEDEILFLLAVLSVAKERAAQLEAATHRKMNANSPSKKDAP